MINNSAAGPAESAEREPTPSEIPESTPTEAPAEKEMRPGPEVKPVKGVPEDLSGLEATVASRSGSPMVEEGKEKPEQEKSEAGLEKLTEALRQFYDGVQGIKKSVEQRMEIIDPQKSLNQVIEKSKEEISNWQINEYLGNSDYLDLAIELAFKSASFAEMHDSLTNDKQYQGLKDYLMGK